MKKYQDLSTSERRKLYDELIIAFNEYKERGLSLDISRGKPNSKQLDLIQGLQEVDMSSERSKLSSGFDCRNYGLLDGVPEMKQLIADVYELSVDDVIVGGNSSLQLMHDALMRAMVFGFVDSPRPWCREEKIRWICVTPGYDRHFAITEMLGFEMINVRMLDDGPDMDEVERLCQDETVKGIWCIPKYSNPSGNTYSAETVRRLVSMKCAAPDFRIMWDNAYAVHDFDENGDTLANIMEISKEYGNENRVLYFGSTSKITFPGSGVAFLAASAGNRAQILPLIGKQTISFDKLNQLRHYYYFGNAENVHKHMLVLGGEIKKKFDIVLKKLNEIRGLGIAEWTEPRGGYFISLDVMPGTATRVYELMKELGVTLTKVGATYPYGKDPLDTNLRIAPTYPSLDELLLASDMLVLTVKMAALEKMGV